MKSWKAFLLFLFFSGVDVVIEVSLGPADVLACWPPELTLPSSSDVSWGFCFFVLLTYLARNFPLAKVQACFWVRLLGSSPALVLVSFT